MLPHPTLPSCVLSVMCILPTCLSLGESRDFNTRSLSLLFLCWQMLQNWWTSVSLCTVPGISTEAGNLWIPPPTSQIIAAYFLCQISLELLLSLPNQYLGLNLMPECRKWHFWASRFQNFLGEHALTPSRKGKGLSGLWSVTATYCIGSATYFRIYWNPPCSVQITHCPLLVTE